MATVTTQSALQAATMIGMLYLSFELGETTWKLAFTTGLATDQGVRALDRVKIRSSALTP